MLRKYTYIFALFSLLGFTAGCSDDLETGQAASNGKGLSLQIAIDNNEENASSRTTLESFDAKNNVQKVQIYVFEGTGDEATYLSQEPTAIDWTPNEQSKTCTLQYASLRNGKEYTLLGVGMDDVFGSTYTIGSKDGGELVVGKTTLEDAYAKLKSGKGKADIAQSEFFTGTVSFEFRGENTNLESLTLRRRVAGVMLYVKDIPQNLYKENDDTPYRTTKVYVKLGRNQKKSVMLQRDFDAENWVEPEGEDLNDSKTLLTLDLSDLEYKNGEDLYTIDHGEGSVLSPNTLYTSCYMLPLNKEADEKTLTVEIWGVENSDGEGTVTGTENLLKSFTVQNKNESNATNFDIRSNYIYCIGKKAEGMDEPISLGNDVILLEVQNWIPIKHEADLGATRVQALFDDTENEIHNCINHEFDITILPPSILVRDQLISVKLFVDNSLTEGLNNAGVPTKINGDDGLTDKEKGLYSNWLYIYDKEVNDDLYYDVNKNLDGSALDDLKAGKSVKMSLFMADYARPRKNWGWIDGKWNPEENDVEHINQDTRSVNLVLETKFYWDTDKDGNKDDEVTRYDYLKVKQYNTITVMYQSLDNTDGEAYCGFSREDLSEKYEWGFIDNGGQNTSIFIPVGNCDSYNGGNNLKKIYHWNFAESFPNSAMGVAQQNGIFASINSSNKKDFGQKIRKSGGDEIEGQPTCWYLPSRYEMEGLMLCSEYVITNIKVCESEEDDKLEWYWTSTVNNIDTGTTYDTWAYRLPANYIPISNSRDRTKREKFNIRQARRFPEEYEYAW